MSSLKKLGGQTAIYGMSSILGRMLNVLMVPLFTSVMLKETYGVLSDLYATVAFLSTLFLLGLETSYFRHANIEDEQKVFNNIQSLIFITSSFFSGLLVLYATPIIEYLGYAGKEHYIYLLVGIIVIDAVSAIPFARLRHQNKAKTFAIFRFSGITLNVLLNLFFLYYLDKQNYDSCDSSFLAQFYSPNDQINYVLYANIIGNSIFLIMVFIASAGYRPSINKIQISKYTTYALPLLFAGLSANINEVIDRRMLMEILPDHFYPSLSTEAAVGVYSGCYKLAIFMSLALQAFRYAGEPFFFSKAKDKDAKDTYALVMKYFIIVCCFILVSISVFRFPIGSLFLRKEGFTDGLIIVPILLLANLFLGIYYNQSVWYKVTNKTKFSAILSGAGALITLTANFLLIPVLGYLGSAVATLLCYFSMAALSYYFGHKHYPVPYKVKNAFLHIFIACGLAGYSLWSNQTDSGTSLLEGAGLIVLYCLSVWIIEKINIRSLLSK